mgnify:CR=1 FL=1
MVDFVLKGANVFCGNTFEKTDLFVRDGFVSDNADISDSAEVFDFSGCYVFPGFIDVHVHLREPGFFYKETVFSGTGAAAHGGYTHVLSMPNLSPVPDNRENLEKQLAVIKNTAKVHVTPYGAITKNEEGKELSDMAEMAAEVCAFSDDGKGVQCPDIMKKAMTESKKLGKIIAAHCEDNSLLAGGYIHDGEYAKAHGHKGICSKSEWAPIKRDIALAAETGARYHVCHISAKESVEIIRKAKADGVDVTCETAPHYLVFSDSDLKDEGRFKMNPPIRSEADRLALIEGIKDGTIDMIATDHAPHSAEEKGKGLKGSLMGVVGLETAFAALYTKLVRTGTIPLEALVRLMHSNPKERFGLRDSLKKGEKACFSVFDLEKKYRVDTDGFLSKGRSTPFEGAELYGRCLMTVCDGKIVWEEKCPTDL